MKLLVTGASGFIGRNLVKRLPRDCDITALYHTAIDYPGFLRANGLSHVRALQVDLADAEQVQARVGSSWDAIVYLAANANPSRSVESPTFDLKANTLSALNLLASCSTEFFLFLSSGAVYDGLTGRVSPASPLAPRLPYAVSKLATEHYLRFYCERSDRIARLTVLRFFGAFGPHEPSRKIYTKMVEAFAARGDREFAIRGDGSNLIDAMYVDDAVDGLLAVLFDRGGGGTFDFGSGHPLAIEQLVRRAAAVWGIDAVHIRRQGTTAEPIAFQMDPRPFAERFGFQASIPLEEGLQRLARFLEQSHSR